MTGAKDPAALLDAARKDLEDAEFNLNHGRTRPAVVFGYYAAFHAAEARIAQASRTASSHKGVNHVLGELYRGTDFPAQSILSQLMSRREAVNYSKSVQPSLDDAERSVDDARSFLTRIESDIGPIEEGELDPAVLQALRNRGLGR